MSLIPPFRFKILKKVFAKDQAVKILDIGCGSHSSTLSKKIFPNCFYSGVDRDQHYDNNEEDIQNMDAFFKKDLTQINFQNIPDQEYDVIIMSHIIEHLDNGDEVVKALIPKLKYGGYFYLEFPTPDSVNFPSKKGTLNFYDDDTHCRLYSIQELSNVLENQGLSIESSGKNRRWINIALMPIKIPLQLIINGYVQGGVYWDWYGFADFVFGKKVN